MLVKLAFLMDVFCSGAPHNGWDDGDSHPGEAVGDESTMTDEDHRIFREQLVRVAPDADPILSPTNNPTVSLSSLVKPPYFLLPYLTRSYQKYDEIITNLCGKKSCFWLVKTPSSPCRFPARNLPSRNRGALALSLHTKVTMRSGRAAAFKIPVSLG